MMRTFLLISVLLCIATFATPQQSATPAANNTAPMQASAIDRTGIEAALKKYEAAYQHMSMYELQQVWPDLPNQKKEYRKAEELIKGGNVSSLQVSVEIQNLQVNGDDAIVQGVESDQYLKSESSTYYGGDNSIAKVGTQTPGPTPASSKRSVKKTQDVTIRLHHNADSWLIVSLEEKGKHH